jgi:WXXGXW repeat (2 copies)
MKKFLVAQAFFLSIIGGAATARAQVSIDVHIGPPPPPPAYRVAPPPGPEYEWVDGYWYPQGKHYRWHDGYWTRAPYPGAYWVQPYYLEGRYYTGHWEGPRGWFEHDHRWDRTHERDERRYERRAEHHEDRR